MIRNITPPLLIAALSLASCTEDPSEAELKKNIHTYSDAYLTGDSTRAHRLLSQRCQAELPHNEFAFLTDQARDTYGKVAIEKITVTINDDTASATYTYPVAAINQTDETWVLENGAWHNDDC